MKKLFLLSLFLAQTLVAQISYVTTDPSGNVLNPYSAATIANFPTGTLKVNGSTISGGGGGTVTSVAVTTANGVSGTVTNPTTTPAISLTLGAITPTSVNGNTITTGTGTLTLGANTLNIGAGGTLGSAAFTASSAYDTAGSAAAVTTTSIGAVPTSRTLTINGTTLDLTANRTWTVGNALTANPLSQFASTTSAQLAGVISDGTGTGSLVFATSPTLVTPTIGAATATSVNKLAISGVVTSATLTIADGSSIYANGAGEVVLYVKNIAVLTAGAPADIATITVPTSFSRFGWTTAPGVFTIVVESQTGTTAAATCNIRTAATGGGAVINAAALAPGAAAGTASRAAGASAGGTFVPGTTPTLYINQTVNSANAGNLSFYVKLQPLP